MVNDFMIASEKCDHYSFDSNMINRYPYRNAWTYAILGVVLLFFRSSSTHPRQSPKGEGGAPAYAEGDNEKKLDFMRVWYERPALIEVSG